MYDKVKNYVQKNELLQDCRHIVIGLSGGADSVCLAHIVQRLSRENGFTVSALHVHHGIRGEEADRDRDYCAEFCGRLGIEYKEVYYDVPEYAADHGLTCEEAGRILRYEALRTEADSLENARIAVAHHMNDQAETVIFNMCRGSGIRGMRGMLAKRDGIIRPLLCCTREEIEEYLAKERIEFCTDSTNEHDDYARNRIRHSVIPYLEQNINVRAVQNIAAMANRMAEAEEYLEKETDRRYEEAVEYVRDGILIRNPEQGTPYMLKRIIMKALGELASGMKDIGETHIESVAALADAQSGKYADVRQGITARREQNGILIYRDCQNEVYEPLKIEVPSVITPWDRTERFEFEIVDWNKNKKILNNIYTKCFDYDKIKVGLWLRTREEGDYLVIDSQGHRKKLNQYFIDEKIPEYMRKRTILLADGHHIMWVVGRRISAEYKITDDTKRVLAVHCKGAIDGES